MDFTALNTVIATLFVIMVVGFACRKLGIIDDVASKKLSALILKVGQPAMIINALANAEYSDENLKVAGISIVITFILHVFLAIVAYFMCVPIKKSLDERKITEFSLVFVNCAFIGFPIYEALFGKQGLFMASFLIITFNVLLWTWGISIFARKRDDIKLTVKKIFLNFGTVPCAIGFLLYLLKNPAIGFEMPTFASSGLQYLQNLCTPVSVLITGALIATQSPKKLLGRWQIYYFNIMKLVVLPLLVCLACKLIGIVISSFTTLPDSFNMYAMFLTATAAIPTASSVSMLTELYDLDSGYSSLTVGTSSLLAILSLPVIMRLAELILG